MLISHSGGLVFKIKKHKQYVKNLKDVDNQIIP